VCVCARKGRIMKVIR